MKQLLSAILIFFSAHPNGSAQVHSLEDCLSKALQNNNAMQLARQSLETRQHQYQAAKLNHLPKADLIAGFNYLSKPLALNIQDLKDGISEGVAQGNVNAANNVYQEITGNNLPQSVQDRIFSTTQSIVTAFYPKNNPAISRQEFITAGILFRQPLYLGGKLKALQELAKQQVESGKANLDAVNDQLRYLVTSQYIQLLYLNSMINKQAEMVAALTKTQQSAADLLTAEITPPYHKKWVDILLSQGQANYANLELEKENALLQMKELMGVALEDSIRITDTLSEGNQLPSGFFEPDLAKNTDLRLLNSKREEAGIAVQSTRASNYPNLFAIANYQFLQRHLPAIVPPWMVGIELQWNLTDWLQNSKRMKASKSLRTETELLIEQKKQTIQLGTLIAQNKIASLRNQLNTLKLARDEALHTTQIVQTRLDNSMASVKDVNDAQKLQFEAEKLYYTSLMAYKIAIATYLYISGSSNSLPQSIH